MVLRFNRMAPLKIKYPKTLKDIPSWRQRQIEQDLRWFLRLSPAQRLECVDREWKEIQEFIRKFGLKKHETRKRG